MRILLVLLLLAAPAQAQFLSGSADATIDAPAGPLEANGTLVQEIGIQLTVVGLICDSATLFRVPLQVEADNASFAPLLAPDVMEFTVPAGTTLATAHEETLQTALVVTGPPNSTTQITIAAGAPSGQCLALGAIERAGDTATLSIVWPAAEVAEEAPQQILPMGPAWAGVLLALVLALRGPRDNGPK